MASERPARHRALEWAGGLSINCEGSAFYGVARMDITLVALILEDIDWPAVARELRIPWKRMQVLRRVLLDETADDIAKALGRKKKTIEWHIEQTRLKWGVHSRAAINTIILTTAWRIQMRGLGEGEVMPSAPRNDSPPV